MSFIKSHNYLKKKKKLRKASCATCYCAFASPQWVVASQVGNPNFTVPSEVLHCMNCKDLHKATTALPVQ